MQLNVLITLTAFVCIGSEETQVKKDVSDVYNIYTTQAFYVQIPTDALSKSLAPIDAIEFIPSILGMPDLPVWMQYKHVNHSQKAYLYGSPALDDDRDIEIEVISINQFNYETHKQVMKFRVTKRERTAKFEVELKFVNYNIDDMFEYNRFDDVLEIFRDKLWKDSQDVYITKIASPLDVGGRLPLDPREKEGVILRIGSTDNYTRDILDLEREVDRIKNRNPCPRKYKATTAEYMFRNKGFYSDWCSFQLIRDDSNGLSAEPVLKVDTSVSLTPRDDDNLYDNYIPFGRSYPRRDYTVDIMVCFVIPLLIATMIVSSLMCIFFYNNEDQWKACNETPKQLQQYNSISRATLRLRYLAQNRDYPATDVFTSIPFPPLLLNQTTGTSTLPRVRPLTKPIIRAHSFHQMSSASDTVL